MNDNELATEFLTDREISKRLHVRLRVVQRLAREGRLPGTKIGKAWRFLWPDVVKWHRQHGAGASGRKEVRNGGHSPAPIEGMPSSGVLLQGHKRNEVPPIFWTVG